MEKEEFYWVDKNDTNTKMSTVEGNGRVSTRGINHYYGKQRDQRSDVLANYSPHVSKGTNSLRKTI